MSYRRVLVALDVVAEDATNVVAQRAVELAAGDALTAVHVFDEGYLYFSEAVAFRGVPEFDVQARAEVRRRLDAACARAGIEQCVLLEGRAAKEIRQYAELQGADLIVMGAHGRHGWQQMLLGSTANAVLHGTPCDVLCVHIPAEVKPPRDILVAVDGSEESRAVFGRATEMAAISGARVSVVSVVRPLEHTYAAVDVGVVRAASFAQEAEAHVLRELNDLAGSFGIGGETIVRRGHPAREIRDVAKELSADLLVLGTHGRHGFDRLLGSTANAVLRGATCDVLAVRVGA